MNIYPKVSNLIWQIKNNELENYFFSIGESWGAEIIKEGVYISFVIDEKYFDIIPLDCFYKILINWVDFIKTKPNLERELIIECKI